MLLVQLTELPHKDCSSRMALDVFRQLHFYKMHFLNEKTIKTLIDHVTDILTKEEKTNKHDQMIELIIVLFKQLLQIPDD
jgi:hypothetical protein